jgi:hypothetical protein
VGRRRSFAYEREEAGKTRLRRAESDPARDDATPAQAEVLRLQRGGGNEAVAGVLARDNTKTQPPPPRKYGPEELPKQKSKVMKIEGLEDIPLLAINPPTKDGSEVTVTISRDSPALVELQKRARSGGALGKVTIDFGGGEMLWVLTDVYVGSIEVGAGESGSASVTLNYVGISVGRPEEPAGTPDKPG